MTFGIKPITGSSLLDSLRDRWQRGDLPNIWDAIPNSGDYSLPQLVEIFRHDQSYRWRQHEPILVESYLERCPRLLADDEATFTLIEAEIAMRHTHGQTPLVHEYVRRFPRFQERLKLVFGVSGSSRTLLPNPASPSTPAATAIEQTLFPNPTPAPAASQNTPRDLGATCIIENPIAEPNARPDETMLPPPGMTYPTPSAPQANAVPEIPGYEVLGELGRGGMGVVYKARQTRAGRDVALKVIRPDMLAYMPSDTQANTVGRFRHEARAAGRLQHDNIVTVFEVGEWNSYHYYAMRLVDGQGLNQMIREKPLENKPAAEYLSGTARGVQFAHEQGILHRDLKPHNVLIDRRTNRALVADFGLAKFTADSDELTRAGEVIGTPSYMSPEQAQDSSKVSALSDVYSLGATLYHVLTGRPPFQAANLGETLRQIIHEEPLAPRQLNPAIDADLETICLKCLQKETSRRYVSAGALADDLDRFLRGEPILARPVSITEKTIRWCKRNPALANSLASAGLLALIAVLAIVIGYRNTAIERDKAYASLSRALDTVNAFLTKVSEEDLLKQPGAQKLRSDLLIKASEQYEAFLHENAGNPRVQRELANAHFRVGQISKELNKNDEAMKSLDLAESQLQKLIKAHPDEPQLELSLSDVLNVRGQLFAKQTEDHDALLQFETANRIREKLSQQLPNAEEIRRKLASSRMNLGVILRNLGKYDLALQQMELAQQIRRELLQQDPQNDRAFRDYGIGAYSLADLQMALAEQSADQKNINDAISNLKLAVDVFEKLVAKENWNVETRLKLIFTYRVLAGKLSEPLSIYEKAKLQAESLVRDNPDVVSYKKELALLLLDYGNTLSGGDEPSERALEFAKQIDDLLTPFANENDTVYTLAETHRMAGVTAAALGKIAQAKESFGLSLRYWKMLDQRMEDKTHSQEQIRKVTALIEDLKDAPVKQP